jgi:hypothetical protein
MKLYHGTAQAFQTFNMSLAGTATADLGNETATMGVWLTDDISYAQDYARNAAQDGEGIVLAAEVNVQRFERVSLRTIENNVRMFGAEGTVKMYREAGFNGLICRNQDGYPDEYCAFNPKMVRNLRIA